MAGLTVPANPRMSQPWLPTFESSQPKELWHEAGATLVRKMPPSPEYRIGHPFGVEVLKTMSVGSVCWPARMSGQSPAAVLQRGVAVASQCWWRMLTPEPM